MKKRANSRSMKFFQKNWKENWKAIYLGGFVLVLGLTYYWGNLILVEQDPASSPFAFQLSQK